MKTVLCIFVTLTFTAGIASGLQLFGHPCGEGEKESEKTCDSALGLICNVSRKVCECLGSNNSTGSEKINPVWSKGECALKVKDTCLITNSSASHSKPSTENGTDTESTSTQAPASASPLRCISQAECIDGTCQCIHGHHPNKDLSVCESTNGSFSITGIPIFVGLISMVVGIISQ